MMNMFHKWVKRLLYGILIILSLAFFFGPGSLAGKAVAIVMVIAGTIAHFDILIEKENQVFFIPLIFFIWTFDPLVRYGISATPPYVLVTIFSFVAVLLLRRKLLVDDERLL